MPRIVDGDTIHVQTDNGQALTVRLIGMDTPEILPVGTPIGLERDVQEFDRYGRTLAYIWTADGATMVNEQLVAEGYAVVLTIPPDVRHVERFTTAQQAARDAGAGLWTGCTDGPQDASDDAPSDDQPTTSAPPPPPAVSAPAPTATAGTVPPPPASKPQSPPAASGGACDPSYPDFCIPPPPPDLNCTSPSIAGHKNFTVKPPDPHHFDADHDGVGCEATRR